MFRVDASGIEDFAERMAAFAEAPHVDARLTGGAYEAEPSPDAMPEEGLRGALGAAFRRVTGIGL